MIKVSVGRRRDFRKLLLRNLTTSVILHESVTTSEAKARAVQPIVERTIHLAQQYNDRPLTIRRRLLSYLTDEMAVKKVIEEIAPRYTDVTSGFTRRVTVGHRLGDNANQVAVQLTRNVIFDEAKPKTAVKPAIKAGDTSKAKKES